MVHQMASFDVTYERRAFRTKTEHDGMRHDKLAKVLKERAENVLHDSRGRWIITPKNGYLYQSDAAIELTVTVPSGDDQSKQMIAAVKELERRFEQYPLALPVDTSLRTIEGNGPGCEICGKKSDWFRFALIPRNRHFCDEHAKAEPDFIVEGEVSIRWIREDAVTT